MCRDDTGFDVILLTVVRQLLHVIGGKLRLTLTQLDIALNLDAPSLRPNFEPVWSLLDLSVLKGTVFLYPGFPCVYVCECYMYMCYALWYVLCVWVWVWVLACGGVGV